MTYVLFYPVKEVTLKTRLFQGVHNRGFIPFIARRIVWFCHCLVQYTSAFVDSLRYDS